MLKFDVFYDLQFLAVFIGFDDIKFLVFFTIWDS